MKPITVPGTLDSLGPIGRFVTDAVDAAGLDRKTAYQLRLAVDEIATNAIVYGYAEAGLTGELVVRAEMDDKSLRISLEDTGVAFDPRSVPPPDGLDLPLEQRQMGGLGVYLAMQSVDDFFYERIGDRNRNVFIVSRPSASPGSSHVGK